MEDQMPTVKPLTIAYTPDSDDAFYYDALETKLVALPGFLAIFSHEPMSALNRAALCGVYDVTAISSIIYPQIFEEYAILSVGTSVGRGYGPVLVSRHSQSLSDLRGGRVGVGGIPEAIAVEMPYDEIADAVAVGELDAGVMIHEELLFYPQLGLHRVLDLGAAWCEQQGLPLPVGLNVIRRNLGTHATQRICAAIRQSLQYALDHSEDSLARVSRFGRGITGGCTNQFVTMFANKDSLVMPTDVRTALRVLFSQIADQGLCESLPPIDIIEGFQRAASYNRQAA
jgi:1,4-dihydroxy-6-naphthoate synthase